MTGTNQSWRIIMEDAMASVNQMEPGIFDVRSGPDQGSLEGTPSGVSHGDSIPR
jgi:hypothetical protein